MSSAPTTNTSSALPAIPPLNEWSAFLDTQVLPVLRITERQINELRQEEENADARRLAKIILNDPVMTVGVIAFMQTRRSRALHNDIRTIHSALVMAGLPPFFAAFSSLPTLENTLNKQPRALLSVLRIIQRAQRAADYAEDWAIRQHDLNMEEVRTAALLHDLAEILVGAFFPRHLLAIESALKQHPGMRSGDAQQQILGFTCRDLQKLLNQHWNLPELLQNLMDMDSHDQPTPRVATVGLAIRLARHSAHGWLDAALPDDLNAISQLLHLPLHMLYRHLNVPDEVVEKLNAHFAAQQ